VAREARARDEHLAVDDLDLAHVLRVVVGEVEVEHEVAPAAGARGGVVVAVLHAREDDARVRPEGFDHRGDGGHRRGDEHAPDDVEDAVDGAGRRVDAEEALLDDSGGRLQARGQRELDGGDARRDFLHERVEAGLRARGVLVERDDVESRALLRARAGQVRELCDRGRVGGEAYRVRRGRISSHLQAKFTRKNTPVARRWARPSASAWAMVVHIEL